jgi:hypothetical protein
MALLLTASTASVFYCFGLNGEDLFASEKSLHKDINSESPSCQSDQNRSKFISNNHGVSDFFSSKPPERDDVISEPRYSKKTNLSLTFIKYLPKKSFSICDWNHSLCKPAQVSLSSYLLYRNLRI